MLFRYLLLVVVSTCISVVVAAASPEQVVVVYRKGDAESLQIAQHYQRQRQIPSENLIGIECPTEETIGWSAFVEQIFNPLRKELLAAGLWQGSLQEGMDVEGRSRVNVDSSRVRYLVLCRGIPLRISEEIERNVHAKVLPPQQAFQTNRASVDAELALLALNEAPIIGFVPNPLYNQAGKPESEQSKQILRVTRLDGPTAEIAMGLVDRAIEAEQRGLIGRAYVDMGGRHPRGDEWLQAAADVLEQMGYDLTVDKEPEVFGRYDRFDAPAFYFGWYTTHAKGPMMQRDARFVPGAVGFHIHSFSAQSLRTDRRHWAGPLLAHGLTATVGNVWEPYLELTHNPVLLLVALAQGSNFADASYNALPALSWQAVAIGDPLYQPMAFSFEQQLQRAESEADEQTPYLYLRLMHLLERRGQSAAALEVARKSFARLGGLPLAAALIERELAQGNSVTVSQIVQQALPGQGQVAAADSALVYALAQRLQENDQSVIALELLRRLLLNQSLPREVQIRYLGDGFHAARAAGNQDLADEWSTRLALLRRQVMEEEEAKARAAEAKAKQ